MWGGVNVRVDADADADAEGELYIPKVLYYVEFFYQVYVKETM